jgi:hypothetical protein
MSDLSEQEPDRWFNTPPGTISREAMRIVNLTDVFQYYSDT